MKKVLQSFVLLLVLGALMEPTAAYAQSIYGDVNGDIEVNISDINAVIAIIMGDNGPATAADVNMDGEISINDINAVIHIILGGSPPTPDNHEYVDLGLPSGTLWATMNIGATSPEDYGYYFAWGETKPKGSQDNYSYDWSTYKWCDGSSTTLTKYCTRSDYGWVDGKTELTMGDDAAYINWGAFWRMPSEEQISELVEHCTWQWTSRNDNFGRLVIGPNGNSIFLPAAGYRTGRSLYLADWSGQYWTRTLSSGTPNYACSLFFYSPNWFWSAGSRQLGYSVRAVRAQ